MVQTTAATAANPHLVLIVSVVVEAAAGPKALMLQATEVAAVVLQGRIAQMIMVLPEHMDIEAAVAWVLQEVSPVVEAVVQEV